MSNTILMRTTDGSILRFEYHTGDTSVSELAKKYCALDYPDRYVVFSENSTHSSFRGNQNTTESKIIKLSMILRPSMFPSQVGFLRAMSTVALLSALEEHTSKSLGIGWPSDIYCEGRRIGGVIIEGRLDNFSSYEYLIVNFSVNLSDADFPPRLNDLVKKVFESENASVCAIIAKNILHKFFSLYPKIKTPSKFMDRYKEKFIMGGKMIKYIDGGKKRRCKVLNVDNHDGSLIIETRGGVIKSITSPKQLIIPQKFKI